MEPDHTLAFWPPSGATRPRRATANTESKAGPLWGGLEAVRGQQQGSRLQAERLRLKPNRNLTSSTFNQTPQALNDTPPTFPRTCTRWRPDFGVRVGVVVTAVAFATNDQNIDLAIPPTALLPPAALCTLPLGISGSCWARGIM